MTAFVCPACRGPLSSSPSAHTCQACARAFPVVCGISDFRLEPDPYIDLETDRKKAETLFEAGRTRTFEELVRYYYSITPEDPPDLADRWTRHALAEVEIARGLLDAVQLPAPDTARWLDVGCATGALLRAVAPASPRPTGVDVALRWLAVGLVRLRDASVDATLVCANAEHLPFADGSFGAVSCIDTLEHVRDPDAALREAHRVSAVFAPLVCTANNRLAPAPEPNLRLWGVGYLPRRWQPAYVRWRRGDLHPYRIRLLHAGELRSAARQAGYGSIAVRPAPIVAPHASPMMRGAVAVYERVRGRAITTRLLTLVGPRLLLTARATPSRRSSP